MGTEAQSSCDLFGRWDPSVFYIGKRKTLRIEFTNQRVKKPLSEVLQINEIKIKKKKKTLGKASLGARKTPKKPPLTIILKKGQHVEGF